jgi:cell division protein FtsQ
VAKNSYSNRTTLWDDQDPDNPAAPQATPARGAWRAPSAVLAGERPSRRVVSAIPAVSSEDDEEIPASRNSVPRRTRLSSSRNSSFGSAGWRPKTSFARIFLAIVAFILLAILVTAGILVRNFLVRDPRFRIQGASSIQSTGLAEVNRTEILPVFGSDIGRNIFFVPLAARRKELESIPWVQRATVMRFLPDRLSISIVERTPIAFVREGSQVELADADGVLLTMPPSMMAQHHYSFPVLTGINEQDPLPARRQRMAVYQRFVSELNQNNQHLADQVSEIDLTDPEDLRATLPAPGGDILLHFGEDHFLERLQLYQTHIAGLRSRYPKLIGVDLRYGNNVALEMSTDTPATTLAAANAPAIPVPATAKPKSPAANPALPQKSQTVTPKSVTPRPQAKPSSTSTAKKPTAAERKAAEAKKKAAKLKADKSKAAREKAAKHKSPPTPAAATQGN